jgi:hypothetical protein
MPNALDSDHFIPEHRLPIKPLLTTLHAAYATMARARSSGLALLDDGQPVYFVTADFVHAVLISAAERLENTDRVETAAISHVSQYIARLFSDRGFREQLTDILKGAEPIALRISPRTLGSEIDPTELVQQSDRYGFYRVLSPSPSRSGWYAVQSGLNQGVFTPPATYTCVNGHQNDDFDWGICIVCQKALYTRP